MWLQLQVMFVYPRQEVVIAVIGISVASLKSGDWAFEDEIICVLRGVTALWTYRAVFDAPFV